MAAGIGQIHVKKERGLLVVVGKGATPRGKSYIKKTAKLKVKSPSDPMFKDELAAAIKKMLPEKIAKPE